MEGMKKTLALLITFVATLPLPNAFADMSAGIAAYIAEDYKTAFKELEAAARQENTYAQFGLGRLLSEGQGAPKNQSVSIPRQSRGL